MGSRPDLALAGTCRHLDAASSQNQQLTRIAVWQHLALAGISKQLLPIVHGIGDSAYIPPAFTPTVHTLSLGTRNQVVCHAASADFGDALMCVQQESSNLQPSRSEVWLKRIIRDASPDPCAGGVLVLSRCPARVFCNTEYGFRKGG